MPWWLVALIVVISVLTLDRLLLWMEARGWIFYRKKKPTGGGAAMLGVAAELFQPAQHSAVQELEEQSRRLDDAGDADPLDRTRMKFPEEQERLPDEE